MAYAGSGSWAAVSCGLVYDGHDLAEALRTGALKVQGEIPAVERFLTLFDLPPKAPARS